MGMGCTTFPCVKMSLFLCFDISAVHGTVLDLNFVSQEHYQSVQMMIHEHNILVYEGRRVVGKRFEFF